MPPFGSQNEKREPEGFDVELASMIAKALGVKLEMQQITAGNREVIFFARDRVVLRDGVVTEVEHLAQPAAKRAPAPEPAPAATT